MGMHLRELDIRVLDKADIEVLDKLSGDASVYVILPTLQSYQVPKLAVKLTVSIEACDKLFYNASLLL